MICCIALPYETLFPKSARKLGAAESVIPEIGSVDWFAVATLRCGIAGLYLRATLRCGIAGLYLRLRSTVRRRDRAQVVCAIFSQRTQLNNLEAFDANKASICVFC